jgi:hypothetical protein
MGCHPLRTRAEPERSQAERKACEINGLYATFDVKHRLSWPSFSGVGGLAHASQAVAGMSVIAPATRKVISVSSIVDAVLYKPVQFYGRNPSKII